jgi:carbon-monoxide dehydrogenase medium subunit
MHAIRYEAPSTISETIRLLQADPDARIMAGGTDLLVQFRAGLRRPTAFIDIKRIPELVDFGIDDHGLRIGAATPAAALVESDEIRRLYPGLSESIALIGSMQIQGRGSVGGNLCNASPAADTPCALIVNRAECVLAGPAGTRHVPVEAFLTGPGKTVLAPGEFLIAIHVPRPAPRTADAYLRLTPRSEMDIAVVGAAVSLTLDEHGRCTTARVALAAVAPTPLLVAPAAAALLGTHVDEQALDRAASAAREAARPIDDKRGTVAYRRQVAGVLTRRAAESAVRRAKGL